MSIHYECTPQSGDSNCLQPVTKHPLEEEIIEIPTNGTLLLAKTPSISFGAFFRECNAEIFWFWVCVWFIWVWIKFRSVSMCSTGRWVLNGQCACEWNCATPVSVTLIVEMFRRQEDDWLLKFNIGDDSLFLSITLNTGAGSYFANQTF